MHKFWKKLKERKRRKSYKPMLERPNQKRKDAEEDQRNNNPNFDT